MNNIFTIFIIMLIGVACQIKPNGPDSGAMPGVLPKPLMFIARVVRIMPNETLNTWRIKINNTGISAVLSNSDLTNRLAGLHLHQGDLILLGNLPDQHHKSGTRTETWDWLFHYAGTNKVALYRYGEYSASLNTELFSIQVYHWSAPYNDPMQLENALFFREGMFLGVGKDGFQAVVNEVYQNRPKKIFVLGSMYNMHSSLPFLPVPYEIGRLDKLSQETGTKLILMDPLPY